MGKLFFFKIKIKNILLYLKLIFSYLGQTMDYMFQSGFLGTRAPFFMDFVTLIVALLPLLVLIAISFAKIKAYTLHAFTQTFIFIISVIVVGYFEYGVRLGGGFDAFLKGSSISHDYALWVLIIHIIIAIVTLVIWTQTLISANKDKKRFKLPGQFSAQHKKSGIRTFIGISLTSFTGIWVYLLLFVY
jgi:putative membrane protein